MFITTINPNIKRKMQELRKMYPRNKLHLHLHKTPEEVHKEYNNRVKAAKTIQKFVRFMKRMNKAKSLSPKQRTINNPLWRNFVNYQTRNTPRKKSPPKKLPVLPRNFGTWFNWGNAYVRPNTRAVYYPNLKTLWFNGKLYYGKNLEIMGIPF